MGDRIEELPVDQIVPSKDEKQILDSMFVPSGPVPTNLKKSKNESPPPVKLTPPPPLPGEGEVPTNGLKNELQTAVLLALLFCACSIPQMDGILTSMIPFLKRSDIFCILAKGVLFMMIAYLMLNWDLLVITRARP